MTPRPALTLTPLQRDQRKLNLLLASRLVRGQAMIALDELGGRADSVADSVSRVRQWLSSPLWWTLGSTLGALLLSIRKRRTGGVGLLSLVWPAWRVWRSVQPVWRALSAPGPATLRPCAPRPSRRAGSARR